MPRVIKAATIERRKGELAARKSAVLDAAEAEFRENAYHAATADGIAERAGVSVGTVYNFFGGKGAVFAAVLERLGSGLVECVGQFAESHAAPEGAVDGLIRYRVTHYDRQRVFFAPFEQRTGAAPDPAVVAPGAAALHGRYLDLVARVFERATQGGLFEGVRPTQLAFRFDGVLNAFVGYWKRPDTSGSLDALCREIRDALTRMAGIWAPEDEPHGGAYSAGERSREVYITQFDRSRLEELIAVAREFGGPGLAPDVSALERELAAARVVGPRDVPADVVTMNSRVRLRDLATGESVECRLVFPADAGRAAENVSVLEPLGTVLLGYRVGALAEVGGGDAPRRYRVEEIPYQPEAAGHYHL